VKVVILAGGLGTRISEETENKPKPMVLIDDKPILWHLMNVFSTQGLNEFVLALGYRSEVIKRWLFDINDLEGSIEVETQTGLVKKFSKQKTPNWKVSALETGLNTQTGGRIRQCMEFLGDQPVIVTYGDGLANVSIKDLLDFHKSHGKLATVTAVRPPARFGYMQISDGQVHHFGEKNQMDEGWINGGFFVLEPKVLEYILSDHEPFETGALPKLAQDGQLMAYEHSGFWQPMDTLREKRELAKLAERSLPPWLEIGI
jgi:glucose-1-phosphate cytidylyltransferase